MTASSDLVELERQLGIAMRGYEAAVAELNRNADHILALEADKAALVEVIKLADAVFRGANMNMSVVERKVRATLAKHGGS